MLERSHRLPFEGWPTIEVGGLPVCAVGIEQSAKDLIDYCGSAACEARARPLFVTSVNGQVLSMCASSPRVFDLFRAADLIHCDGQPLVLLSRRFGPRALPERVATTDLFPAMARLAEAAGRSFYLLGATPEVNERAVAMTRADHPRLRIVGSSHGYLSVAEEAAVAAEIARLKPDVLWVALGAPREQEFVLRHAETLRGVAIVKTSGGLFDFLARVKARAPRWMQSAGLEWLFRLMLEPRRLFWRYFVTNPHALYIMVRTMR